MLSKQFAGSAAATTVTLVVPVAVANWQHAVIIAAQARNCFMIAIVSYLS
jgi:hypothetical protein